MDPVLAKRCRGCSAALGAGVLQLGKQPEEVRPGIEAHERRFLELGLAVSKFLTGSNYRDAQAIDLRRIMQLARSLLDLQRRGY